STARSTASSSRTSGRERTAIFIQRNAMLSPSQLKAREGKLTASRVAALVRGYQEVMRLYLEMTGQQPEENLDNVWAVQLGSATEKLNVEWYERKHNEVSRIGEVVVHPKLPWAACTLDAWDNVLKCPV